MLKSVFLFLFLFISHAIFAADRQIPQSLKFIEKQGGEVVDSFAAPAGMTGYIVEFRGNALTVYLSQDEQYLFTGNMLDATGRDMGKEALDDYIKGPQSEKKWQALLSSNWIPDGSDDAPKVIYAFIDPNCPYCKQLWEKARPWIASGKVQMRYILVGILKADSYGKSAAILSAEDPADALYEHEASESSSLRSLTSPSEAVRTQLGENHRLMQTLGISAVPAIYYKDKSNGVTLQMGLPTPSQLEQIMGSQGG
ncbi:thiol:disulfide interchange protein DsbG [Alteromonas sp. 14N.309.X.WAT.G.H12]|uniref:thiol:disulfide interchange protein DsbG n=1 Tax=Alteromonas sp. 14N.309.X.WAT.G.H12 TaxID=3120824 RepID=UPI002FD3EF38